MTPEEFYGRTITSVDDALVAIKRDGYICGSDRPWGNTIETHSERPLPYMYDRIDMAVFRELSRRGDIEFAGATDRDIYFRLSGKHSKERHGEQVG